MSQPITIGQVSSFDSKKQLNAVLRSYKILHDSLGRLAWKLDSLTLSDKEKELVTLDFTYCICGLGWQANPPRQPGSQTRLARTTKPKSTSYDKRGIKIF